MQRSIPPSELSYPRQISGHIERMRFMLDPLVDDCQKPPHLAMQPRAGELPFYALSFLQYLPFVLAYLDRYLGT